MSSGSYHLYVRFLPIAFAWSKVPIKQIRAVTRLEWKAALAKGMVVSYIG
ncbi:hypothetical protein H845_752 [Komagataeibacter xylinus E25]|nr:hypothetical protein H845_752 [Komagataeibacter xylinus E25]